MTRLLVAAPVVLFLVGLVVGAATGRIRAGRACCAVADPRRDLRMRAAFDDEDAADADAASQGRDRRR
ncbi:MAG: hypothetical protein ACKVZ6_15435 [Kineosporiaceae bacterium]